MKEVLSRVFSNPRTTLAGALSVALTAVLASVIPALVAYFGGQPGPGWLVVAFVLGLLPSALMKDKKEDAK